MKSMMKRTLSMLMAVVMVVGVAVSGGIATNAESNESIVASLIVTCKKAAEALEDPKYGYAIKVELNGTEQTILDADKTVPIDDNVGTAQGTVNFMGFKFTLALDSNKVPKKKDNKGSVSLQPQLTDVTGADIVEIKSETDNTATYETSLNDGVEIIAEGGAAIKWSLKDEVDGISIDEGTGKLTVASTTEDSDVVVVAKLFNSDNNVCVEKSKTVKCLAANATSEGIDTKIKNSEYYSENKTLVETFKGNFITENLCKDNSKVKIVEKTEDAPKPSCNININDAKTEATLTYTFSEESSYAYKYNDGDEVAFTIDKKDPTANLELINDVKKDSKDNKKTINVSGLSENDAKVEIGTEDITETLKKEYKDTAYTSTKMVSVTVSDKAGNSTQYKDVAFINGVEVKVYLNKGTVDNEDWKEITDDTASNIIDGVRYFANEIKLEVTGIPTVDEAKGEALEVKVGGVKVTTEEDDKTKYIKKLSTDGDTLTDTSVEITYTKDSITKEYTSENTIGGTIETVPYTSYGVDITAPEVTTAFNDVVENNPIYAKQTGETTTIYVKLKDKVEKEKLEKNDETTKGTSKTVVITGTSSRAYNTVAATPVSKEATETIEVSTECQIGLATTIDISTLFVTNDAGVPASVKLGDYTIEKEDYEAGKYIIVVDRATPVESQTSPAHIAINLEETNKVGDDNTGYFYTDDVSFTIGAYDPDSGIEVEGIKYWVKNSNGTLTIADETIDDEAVQTYTSGTATLGLNKNSEQNNIELIAEVTDNTGNISRTSVTFNVDNYAPRVNVSFDNNDVKNDKYFKADRTATVTVEDLNFKAENVVVTANSTSNTDWNVDSENANKHTITYTFNPGEGKTGEYSFSVTGVKDLAENATVINENIYKEKQGGEEKDVCVAHEAFVIDKEAPTISYVEDKVTEVTEETEETEGAIWYNDLSEEKIFTFKFNDTYLDLDGSETDLDKCELTYGGKNLLTNNSIIPVVDDSKPGEYSFTIAYGEKLTDITVRIVDLAGNELQSVDVSDTAKNPDQTKTDDMRTAFTNSFKFKAGTEQGEFVYDGLPAMIDNVDPVVGITLPTGSVNSYTYKDDNENEITNDYYASEQDVIINISDLRIDQENTTVKLNLLNNGKDASVEMSIAEIINDAYKIDENGEKVKNKDSSWTIDPNAEVYPGITDWVITYKLDDGIKFTSASVDAIDMATNKASATETKNIVIDTTAPTVYVDVEAEGGIDNFYMNKNGQVFVNLTDKNKENSGVGSNKDDVHVTLTLKVNDKNIATDSAKDFKVVVSYPSGYTEESTTAEYKDNVDNTFTYTATIDIPVEQNKEASFTLIVSDLAGNKPVNKTGNNTEGDDITVCEKVTQDEGYATTFDVEYDDNGTISKTLNFDRRRVTSTIENSVPTIIIEDVDGNSIVKNDFNDVGRTLYNSDVTYTVYVKDQDQGTASGLASVIWTVDGDGSYVDANGDKHEVKATKAEGYGDKTYGVGVYEDTLTMPITFGTGESNDITLTVTATDKLGNQITAIKYLAIDTVAPRVTYKIDGKPVLYPEGYTITGTKEAKFYFNKDRNATITVTDLNFNGKAEDVKINTKNVADNGTTYKDEGYDKNQRSIKFSGPDVDYTVDFSTTDLADNNTRFGNGTEDSATNPSGAKQPTCIKSTSSNTDADRYKFTVDKVAPTLSVSYDNNNVRNGMYYNADRTATVSIVERNFDDTTTLRKDKYIDYEPKSTKDKGSITNPELTTFSGINAGSNHSATIKFTGDETGNGDYSYTLDYTDLAGNKISTKFVQEEFTIDKEAPEITFSENYNASNSIFTGEFTPTLTISDLNFNDAKDEVTLIHYINLKDSESLNDLLNESTVNNNKGNIKSKTYKLANPSQEEPENDGIYVFSASIEDLAGNKAKTNPDSRTYSVNRFGSTYLVADASTRSLIVDNYTQTAPTIKIEEINPDDITAQSIYVQKNGVDTSKLEDGVDFTTTQNNSSNGWNSNIYTINPSAFTNEDGSINDGEYVITLSSKDVNHTNTNESATKNTNTYEANLAGKSVDENNEAYDATAYDNEMKFSFVLDSSAPVITITNLEDEDNLINDSYYEHVEEPEFEVFISEGYGVAEISVEVEGAEGTTLVFNEAEQEGNKLSFTTTDAEKNTASDLQTRTILDADGNLTGLTLKEDSNIQTVRVVAKDMAGNKCDEVTVNVLVNSNIFVRWFRNTPLFIGSIAGFIALVGGAVLFINNKKKKAA